MYKITEHRVNRIYLTNYALTSFLSLVECTSKFSATQIDTKFNNTTLEQNQNQETRPFKVQ